MNQTHLLPQPEGPHWEETEREGKRERERESKGDRMGERKGEGGEEREIIYQQKQTITLIIIIIY